MTIWLLTVLFLASAAGLGLRQGVLRVAFSFVGILLGALLAVPLGQLVKPVFGTLGVKSPLLQWLLPPLVVFAVILVIFKAIGFAVHRKVELHYKYKADDLRRSLWERAGHRLGLCFGLLNGAAYLVLVSSIIYMLSYWTYQTASEGDPFSVRILNRLGKDLESTGLSKVARAVSRMTPQFYDAGDVAGLLYHNPGLRPRLSQYPAVLSLAERPEFQQLANDAQFSEKHRQKAPVAELINMPSAKAIVNNPESLNVIRDSLMPNIGDLKSYLATGISEKFGNEKILGRWLFDPKGVIMLMRQMNTNISSVEMTRIRRLMAVNYARTMLVATVDNQVLLKNFPRPKVGAPGVELQTVTGQWRNAGGKYMLAFTIDGRVQEMNAEIQGERMSVTGGAEVLAFLRDE